MRLFLVLSTCIIFTLFLSNAGVASQNTQNTPIVQIIDGITIPTTDGVPTPEEARQIAAAAYVYGYPLVFMDALSEHNTAVPSLDLPHGVAPFNQLIRAYEMPIDKFQTAAPHPITDASYFGGWLNLTEEPMVFSVPESNGRYYVIMLEDEWTNNLLPIGPRTTGTGPGNFAIVGPRWNGILPSDMTEIKSPTNLVLIAARTQMDGPADLPAATAFLDNITLTPLNEWNTNYTLPAIVPVTSDVIADAKPSTSAAVIANMTPEEFYRRLTKAMCENSPDSIDQPVIDQIARIGIIPCRTFNWSSMNATMQTAIVQGTQDGTERVKSAAIDWPGAITVNNWRATFDMGNFKTNYTLRAGIASGFGAGNLKEDALYWWLFDNETGIPYSGTNNYLLNFPTNNTPPVNGFWSVTIYDSDGHFVPNPLNQYTITSHSGNPEYNTDGSFDIYIQNRSPGADKESNWLPAPSGEFVLIMRLYWPQEPALDGSWVPPVVQLVDSNTRKLK